MSGPVAAWRIEVMRLPHALDLPLPAYAREGDAGMDLMAAVGEPLWVSPRERVLVPTGLTVALPRGHELQIRSRSGLFLKHGIAVGNAPGTVDEGYRGEIGVILLNTSRNPFEIERGMRIAQAVLAPVTRAEWREVAVLPPSDRGAGGFGSTGG